MKKYLLLIIVILLGLAEKSGAQELNVKINFNTQQIQGTDKSVFENLQQTLEQLTMLKRLLY